MNNARINDLLDSVFSLIDSADVIGSLNDGDASLFYAKLAVGIGERVLARLDRSAPPTQSHIEHAELVKAAIKREDARVADLLFLFTNATGHIYDLSGTHNARVRQELMSLVVGTFVYRNKCGVNALREALFNYAGITGDHCDAEKEKQLANWMRGTRAKA